MTKAKKPAVKAPRAVAKAVPPEPLYKPNTWLAVTWYEDGTRHAGASVEESTDTTLKLRLYPALQPTRTLALTPSVDPGHFVDSRGTRYDLTTPTPKDMGAIQQVVAASQKPEAPVTPGRTKPAAAKHHQEDNERRTITILKKENPFLAGSTRCARLALLKSGMTVADFHAKITDAGYHVSPKFLALLEEKGLVQIRKEAK